MAIEASNPEARRYGGFVAGWVVTGWGMSITALLGGAILGRTFVFRCASWNAFACLAFVAAAPVSAAITIGAPQQIGTITTPTLNEISGLVDSRANAGTFWVHNDSGSSARFYAVSHSGAPLGAFPLTDASAADWEDIAIGPKAGGGNYLYLGDIGDNDAKRSSVSVHRVVEPLSTTSATIPLGSYTTLNLKYPSGARDVEAMFVDPIGGELFLITKRRLVPEVYSVPTSAFDVPGQTVALTSLGTSSKLPLFATAADISPDGRFIVVRSSSLSNGYLYERGAGQSVFDALKGTAIQFPLGSESQGEAIGWAADGKSFFTTSELSGNSTAPIHAYSFAAPVPLLAGDYNNDHVVDAADYAVWRDHLDSDAALANETVTLGSVTAEDYEVWREHFGESTSGGTGAMEVPEPASWLLVLWSATAILGTCVRQR